MRAAAILLLLVGCNQLYGLKDTDPADAGSQTNFDFDFDNDGVLNADDNCATISNHDQADDDGDDLGNACDPCRFGPEANEDSDGDGIDDACDVCVGPNHDEDGDGLFDPCDNCPIQPNADQTNADNDALGDACDLEPGLQRRILFDGFQTIGASWKRGLLFESIDGAATPRLDLDLPVYSMSRPDQKLAGGAWSIEVAIVPSQVEVTGTVGILLEDSTASAIACALWRDTASTWRVHSGVASQQFANPGTYPTLRFSLVNGVRRCELVGSANASINSTILMDPIDVGISMYMAGARIGHIEVIQPE